MDDAGPRTGSRRRRPPTVGLFRRVVLINGGVFTLGTLALAVSPATVSAPIVATEIPVLLIGLGVIMLANTVLLRRSLAPLDGLTSLMDRVDLLRPRDRLVDRGNGDLAGLIETFDAMLDRLEAQRSADSAGALAAQEGERRRIARELHDEIGQSLTAALLSLRRIVDRSPDELRAGLTEVQETVRSSLDEVRMVARRLRPDVLEDLGLASAVTALVTEFTQASEIRVRRTGAVGALPPLTAQVELVLYRIAQECLTNAARHAGASTVELSLYATDSAVVLRVADDGRGGVRVEGAGIRGMRERALLVEADLVLSSPAGGGTVVELTVPVSPGRAHGTDGGRST
ncbi:MAG: histidine kinase [Pseudonocardia sp. SCN 72-86]|nr:MAG: histidine kinase [Pseudonocardia sp. SCN 72-86]